jgi:hypothetical protein
MNDELYTMIQLDLQVSSMGLLDYLSKKWSGYSPNEIR